MRRYTGIAVLLCGGVAFSTHAGTVDVNAGSDAFRVAVFGALPTENRGKFDVGGIVHNERHEDATALHAGVLLTGDTGSQDVKLNAGLGLRAQYLDAEDDEGGGVGLGGEFQARIPGIERLDLSGYGYYQPKVLATGDVEEQAEWALSLGYEVIRGGAIYVGYRELRADVGRGDNTITIDDGLHAGLRLRF